MKSTAYLSLVHPILEYFSPVAMGPYYIVCSYLYNKEERLLPIVLRLSHIAKSHQINAIRKLDEHWKDLIVTYAQYLMITACYS